MRSLVYFLICLTIIACATPKIHETSNDKIVHVVLIWLKESGNIEHTQQIIDATYQLKKIPEIKQLRVGKSVPSDRKIVDDSFDVGLYMTFSNTEDMHAYLEAPKHKEVVMTVLKPLASKIQVYDFEEVTN